MDNIKLFKEKQINNYISNVDLTDIDINLMKSELATLIGESPAIKLNYTKEESLNEDDGTKKLIEKLESFTIIFTIDKEILPGKNMPIPVEKTFFI